jgi:dihydroorotase
LVEAVARGDARFFLGTDSAPHARNTKENACGCAGIFSAHAALELYAEAFEEADALHLLEGFASEFGPRFYGLPLNEDTVTLQRASWSVPDSYPLGEHSVVPLRAGGKLGWRFGTSI